MKMETEKLLTLFYLTQIIKIFQCDIKILNLWFFYVISLRICQTLNVNLGIKNIAAQLKFPSKDVTF